MGTYSLSANIDPKWIKQFNAPGSTMALCLAFGVAESSGVQPNFNVVAALVPGGQNKLSNTVTFTWVEQYQIAATQQSFQSGVKIDATTTALPIQFGQQYTLRADWSGGEVNSSTDAPDNGFIFTIPRNTQATGILFKPVSDGSGSTNMAPFYVSANGPLPQGDETLIPIITAQIWFQSITQTSTMWDGFKGQVWKVTYPVTSGLKNLTVNYNSIGNWGNGPL
jgi:hypothetical protein